MENGSFYSFKEKTHLNPRSKDISLTDDKFKVGVSPFFSGIIVSLGDTDINSITSETEEIKVLSNFRPTKRFSEMTEQWFQLHKGFTSNGKIYSTETPSKLNNTYALRSVNYYDGYYHGEYYLRTYFYDDITLVFELLI